MDPRRVDGTDRGLRIGIRRQQHAAGVRVDILNLAQQIDSSHAGHALVADDEGEGVASLLQLAGGVQGRLPGASTQDPVLLAVMASQILDDRLQNTGVVVNREDDRLGHFRGAFQQNSPNKVQSCRALREFELLCRT